jgi:acetamidase/formamidase
LPNKEFLKLEHKFQADKYFYTFGPHEPVLKLKPQDILVAETVDARGYDSESRPIPAEKEQKSEETEYYPANPLVGPFYVEDAELGDTLIVQIMDIALNRETAWSRIRPNFGSLTEEGPGKRLILNEPLKEQYFTWRIDKQNGVAILDLDKSKLRRIEVALNPFIGSIGVAPRYGRVETSLTPGEYGGNMDCVETKKGVTIYFPVFVRGAYLSFGDVHAVQGDGELCGTAVETSAKVKLKVDVLKNKVIDWPRIEDNEYIMVAGSSRPLMEAYKIAHLELINWLVSDFGFERMEALQVLTQVGTCRVGNVVDPNYTVVSKFPKKYLPT